jgi:hypothetical protein
MVGSGLDYELQLGVEGKAADALGSIDLSWEDAAALWGSLDPSTHSLSAILVGGSTITTGQGSYSVDATLEFVRDNQIDDSASTGVLIGGDASDDIFVASQGDDIVIGGLGEDAYETRILQDSGTGDYAVVKVSATSGGQLTLKSGSTDITSTHVVDVVDNGDNTYTVLTRTPSAGLSSLTSSVTMTDNSVVAATAISTVHTGVIGNGTETLNDLGGAAGSDTVLFEGVRDLGDLDFSRTTLAREGTGRTLEVGYEQYRSDNPDTNTNEAGVFHAFGSVQLFNQFSLSQSDIYKVEGLQIVEESVNPLDAAVKTYLFGDTAELAGETGDVVSAQADEDSILIGTQGVTDEFPYCGSDG